MQKVHFTVREVDSGKRLDVFIAEQENSISRSQARYAVAQGRVRVDKKSRKASYRLCAGETVAMEIPEPVPLAAQPENIPVDVLYEDPWVIVVNKPAGMVVHPACGNYSGTLVNALLYQCTTLSGIGGVIRPGIVHRLDKGTTGVLVVAKNDTAHQGLSEQFKQHSVVRRYSALVFGAMHDPSGTISSPIGRHHADRKKMSTQTRKGRNAVTHWKVLESFDTVTLLEATLETGRTHQVRVHLASIGHPVVGDEPYGGLKRLKAISSKQLQDAFKAIKRPLLHAGCLQFTHPEKGALLSFEAPLPDDFVGVLGILRGGTNA